MSMTDHVTSVSKSLNFHLRNSGRIRKYIARDICHSVVRALVTSRLDYCNSLLNGCTAKNLNRLQNLQNRAARLIYYKSKYTHTTPLLNELHWLYINDRIKFKSLVLTYKCLLNQISNYLSDQGARFIKLEFFFAYPFVFTTNIQICRGPCILLLCSSIME